MKNLQTILYNAILCLYDDSMASYHGIDDEAFIQHVCERTGLTEEEYGNIMLEHNNITLPSAERKENWLILTNNSECDDLSIYQHNGTRQEAYKKMQAMVLATVARTDEWRYVEVGTNSSDMTASIQWIESHEDFRIVRAADVTPIDDADGVADANLDAIPDDIDWDNECAHKALFNLDKEDMEEEEEEE